MTDIDRLIRIASTLTTTKLKLLTEMAQALTRPVDFKKGDTPANPLDNEVIAGYFSNRLVIHHATQEEKFSKKAFEYALRDACRAADKQAEINANPTNPGLDLSVDGMRYSLKTEAALSISEKNITVSKLMEARWIREYTSKDDFAVQTSSRVSEHLSRYDKILILRAFDLYDFELEDLTDVLALTHCLANANDPITNYLHSVRRPSRCITETDAEELGKCSKSNQLSAELPKIVLDVLNRALANGKLYSAERFPHLSEQIQIRLDQTKKSMEGDVRIPTGNARKAINRALIEERFPGEVSPNRRVHYQLYEIPRDLLRKVATLKPDDFSDMTENHTTTAGIYEDGTLLFNLRLDGSVEKITVSSLRTDRCILHGTWTLPTLPPGGE